MQCIVAKQTTSIGHFEFGYSPYVEWVMIKGNIQRFYSNALYRSPVLQKIIYTGTTKPTCGNKGTTFCSQMKKIFQPKTQQLKIYSQISFFLFFW